MRFQNQVVERLLAPVQRQAVGRAHLVAGGADGLVGLLGVGRLGLVAPRLWAEELLAVEIADAPARRADGLFAEVHRVGAHVGDVAVLVEVLGDAHGVAGAQPELAIGLLLQRARREGRIGRPDGVLLFQIAHDPVARQQASAQGFGRRLVEEEDVLAGRDLAGGFVEVAAAGDAALADGEEKGLEAVGRAVGPLVEQGLEIPVLAGVEGAAGALALHQQAHGHALHAAGRELGRDLAPEQRGDRVAHQAIQDAPRLLGADQVHVDFPGVLQRLEDGLAGNFVEDHAAHGLFRVEHLAEMPADALALAIFVGGQENLVGALQGLLQFGNYLAFFVRHHVQRFEVGLDVDAQARPFLPLQLGRDFGGRRRQVTDMTHACLDLVVAGQEFSNRFRFGG